MRRKRARKGEGGEGEVRWEGRGKHLGEGRKDGWQVGSVKGERRSKIGREGGRGKGKGEG